MMMTKENIIPSFVVNGEYVGAEGNDGKYRDENNAIRAIHAAQRAKEAAEIELAGRVNKAATDVEDANIQAQQQQQAEGGGE